MSDSTPPNLSGPATTIVVPRALFDSVPRRRAAYIMAYAAFMALVYVPRLFALAGLFPVTALAYALLAAGLCAYVVFAYHFGRAARVMGYEHWLVLGAIVISISAFPGPILVAYLDRKIATAWDAADPAGGYRRPPVA